MSATGRSVEVTRAALDRYDTPDELAADLVGLLDLPLGAVVIDPCAGGGVFTEALVRAVWSGRDAKGQRGWVEALDLDATAVEELSGKCGPHVSVRQQDFLAWQKDRGYAAVVGNPPYAEAEAFIRHGLRLVRPGGVVAFLLRLGFLTGRGRSPLWLAYPPERVWLVVERPSFRADGGTDSASYAWVVWRRGFRGWPELRWLSWQTDPRQRRTKRKAPHPDQIGLLEHPDG